MQNKKLIATICIFIGVLLVAGVLYSRLGENMAAAGLATTATEATTVATEPPTTEATTAATEPPSAEATTQETEETTEPAHVVPAWDFTALDADGNEVKLSDYFGKPIVLNFWAHWCGFCEMEMPLFNATYEELGGEVVFLMTHVGTGMEKGKEMIAQNGYTFPVIYDTARVAAAGYGVNSFPTSFFIDSDGNLQAYYVGRMSGELLQMGIDMIYTAQNQETVNISEEQ